MTEEALSKKQKQENKIVDRICALIETRFNEERAAQSGMRPEELTKFIKFMESARFVIATASFIAATGAVYEYLTLMGVTDVSPARVVLVCACFFGFIFMWEVVWSRNWKLRRRVWSFLGEVLLVILAMFGLDRWTTKWQREHPLEIAELRNDVNDIKATVHQLKPGTHDNPTVEQAVISFKELRPVPGYLGPEYRYPALPVEQANRMAAVHVYWPNFGNSYVHKAGIAGALVYVDFKGVEPPISEPSLKKTLIDALNELPIGGDDDVAPTGAIWNTYKTPILTDDMYKAIEADTARIYLLTRGSWTSNGNPESARYCAWLQPVSWNAIPGFRTPDATKSDPVWHNC